MFNKFLMVSLGSISAGAGVAASVKQDTDYFELSPFASTNYTSNTESQELGDPFNYLNMQNSSYKSWQNWKEDRYEMLFHMNNEYQTPSEAFGERGYLKEFKGKNFYHATVSKIWFNKEEPKDDLWVHDNITAKPLPRDQHELNQYISSPEFINPIREEKGESSYVMSDHSRRHHTVLVNEQFHPEWDNFTSAIKIYDNNKIFPRTHVCVPTVSYTDHIYKDNNLLLNLYNLTNKFGELKVLNLNLLFDKSCINDFVLGGKENLDKERQKDFKSVFFYRTGDKNRNRIIKTMSLNIFDQPDRNVPISLDVNKYDKDNCGVTNPNYNMYPEAYVNDYNLEQIDDRINDLGIKYTIYRKFNDPVCQLAYSFSDRIRDDVYDNHSFTPDKFGENIDYEMLISYDDKNIKISSKDGQFVNNKRVSVSGNVSNTNNKELFMIPKSFKKEVWFKIKIKSTRTFIPFERIISFKATYRGEQ